MTARKKRTIPKATSRANKTHDVKINKQVKLYRGVTAVECRIDNDDKLTGVYDVFPDVIVVSNAALIVQYNVIQLPGVFMMSIYNADTLGRSLVMDDGMVIAKAIERK